MKRIITIIVCLFVCKISFSNSIDRLKNSEDVIVFLKNVDKGFAKKNTPALKLYPDSTLQLKLNCNGFGKKWNIKSWIKQDLNDDGRTDLLVTIDRYNFDVYAVMDKEDGSFELICLSKNGFENCELAIPVTIGQHTMLLFHDVKRKPEGLALDYTEYDAVDTLVYKFSGFVEYQRKPASYHVKSISLHAGACDGSCPDFTIQFSNNGKAKYSAGYYNPMSGEFSGEINKDKITDVMSLIDYISLKDLKVRYSVPWTDDRTITLKVEFEDRTTKEISDYGAVGIFGLSRLYALIFDLKLTTRWNKIK